jgi:hypothetical protein
MDLNNLSMEGLKILLFLAIIVLGVAVGLISYFMTKRDGAITQATENLVKAVEQLQIIVNSLQQEYKIRQPIVDERLKSHSERLNLHHDRLGKLETEHKMFHCKHQDSE